MKIKLLLFGEAVNIPATSIGLGFGLISVWVDGVGFTSASNNLGSLGYIFLETAEINVGAVDDERAEVFSNLHGRVVDFTVSPTIFVRNGGTARITMSVPVRRDGALAAKSIEFLAEDCRGVSLVSNDLKFSTTMFQLETQLAQADLDAVVSEDDALAVQDAAPAMQDDAEEVHA